MCLHGTCSLRRDLEHPRGYVLIAARHVPFPGNACAAMFPSQRRAACSDSDGRRTGRGWRATSRRCPGPNSFFVPPSRVRPGRLVRRNKNARTRAPVALRRPLATFERPTQTRREHATARSPRPACAIRDASRATKRSVASRVAAHDQPRRIKLSAYRLPENGRTEPARERSAFLTPPRTHFRVFAVF